MTTDHNQLVALMAQVAEALAAPGDTEATLGNITRTAVAVLPGVDYASLSIRYADGRLDTAAPTDETVVITDKLQHQYGEGPCYEVVDGEEIVRSSDVTRDPRWPNYGPKAGAHGIASQMALQLFEDSDTRAALNLYSRSFGTFDDPEQVAELFATQAHVALGHASEIGTLNTALESRRIIGQAVGMIRERYEVDEDRAFGFLVRLSQTGNIKLRVVAEEIVAMRKEADPTR